MRENKSTSLRMSLLTAACLASFLLTAPAVQASNKRVPRTTMKWVGGWNDQDAKQYRSGDVMLFEGNAYICLKKHTSSPSIIPSDDPDHWDLLASSVYWAGAWDENTSYLPGDAVHYEGSSYICTAAVSDSSDAPPNSDYWHLLAAKGGQGEQGEQGDTGLDGVKGDKGDKGDRGPRGRRGVKGKRGAQGQQGLKGDKGDKGDSGTSFWTDGTGQVITSVRVGIGAGAATPAAKLHVDGEIRMEASSKDCDASKVGNIRWSGADFEGCNGRSWVSLTPAPSYRSCDEFPLVLSATGRIWMACNLGASRVALSFNDSEAYGDLYQWGRGTDGHEKRAPLSGTTDTQSSGDAPGHGDFITGSTRPWDWRSPQNDNLWQGVNGINNPCPTGFRLPTEAEWQVEINEYGSTRTALFDSPLKLVPAGCRDLDGTLYATGTSGIYWSSTNNSIFARYLLFYSINANMRNFYRLDGMSVRCIKD